MFTQMTIHPYMYTYTHACTCTHAYTLTQCTLTQMYTQSHTVQCTCTLTHVHTHTCAQPLTHAHSHTLTHAPFLPVFDVWLHCSALSSSLFPLIQIVSILWDDSNAICLLVALFRSFLHGGARLCPFLEKIQAALCSVSCPWLVLWLLPI